MVLFTLIGGELKRLLRYRVFITGLIVSLLWVGITAVISKNEVVSIIPLLILTDTAMMSVLLLAAMVYFEKQEGTLKTTFTAPVETWQALFAKMAASVITGMVSVLLVSLSAVIMHGANINIFLLMLYTALIITANCAIGFLFIFKCKDFNSLLVMYSLFLVVFFILPLFVTFGVFPQSIESLMLISPFYASQELISSAFYSVNAGRVTVCVLYLALLSAILYRFYIIKKYKGFSIGG